MICQNKPKKGVIMQTTEQTTKTEPLLGQKLLNEFKRVNPTLLLAENSNQYAVIIDFCDFVDGSEFNMSTLPIFLGVVFNHLNNIEQKEIESMVF